MGINDVIRVPIFYGDDVEAWVSWVEKFFSDYGYSEEEKLPFVYGFIEGDARTWFEQDDSLTSWEAIKSGLFVRFGNSKDHELARMRKRLDMLERFEKCLIEDEKESQGKGKVQEEENQISQTDDEIIIGSHSKVHVNSTKGPGEGWEVKNEPLRSKLEIPVCDDKSNHRDGEQSQYAHQVFEKMSMREKEKMVKKKKRWKKLSNKRLYINLIWFQSRFKNQRHQQLYNHQVFSRKSLLNSTKNSKEKMEMESERKAVKQNVKLELGHKTLKKKLAKWKKHKFKQKLNMNKIKGRLLGDQSAFLWNPKVEREFFSKYFSEWSKTKSYEAAGKYREAYGETVTILLLQKSLEGARIWLAVMDLKLNCLKGVTIELNEFQLGGNAVTTEENFHLSSELDKMSNEVDTLETDSKEKQYSILEAERHAEATFVITKWLSDSRNHQMLEKVEDQLVKESGNSAEGNPDISLSKDGYSSETRYPKVDELSTSSSDFSNCRWKHDWALNAKGQGVLIYASEAQEIHNKITSADLIPKNDFIHTIYCGEGMLSIERPLAIAMERAEIDCKCSNSLSSETYMGLMQRMDHVRSFFNRFEAVNCTMKEADLALCKLVKANEKSKHVTGMWHQTHEDLVVKEKNLMDDLAQAKSTLLATKQENKILQNVLHSTVADMKHLVSLLEEEKRSGRHIKGLRTVTGKIVRRNINCNTSEGAIVFVKVKITPALFCLQLHRHMTKRFWTAGY